MLTPIQCLSEIASSIPNAVPRFHILDDEICGIDLDKVLGAKSFKGIVVPSDGKQECLQRMVELYLEGGFHETTILTKQLETQLFHWTSEYGCAGE